MYLFVGKILIKLCQIKKSNLGFFIFVQTIENGEELCIWDFSGFFFIFVQTIENGEELCIWVYFSFFVLFSTQNQVPQIINGES